jgi:3-methylfumaryl-CoA hydratase
VQLFRFSALAFNGHRIHYDRDYARNVEHYPGLVVHGPFIAVLLMDLLMRQQARLPTRFVFRAQRPTLDIGPFHICLSGAGADFDLWARDADGNITMTATAAVQSDTP